MADFSAVTACCGSFMSSATHAPYLSRCQDGSEELVHVGPDEEQAVPVPQSDSNHQLHTHLHRASAHDAPLQILSRCPSVSRRSIF